MSLICKNLIAACSRSMRSCEHAQTLTRARGLNEPGEAEIFQEQILYVYRYNRPV